MDPLWPISTPEANHTRLMAGTGTATTLANMAAWLVQLASNEVSFGLSMLNSAATLTNWKGMGATGSAEAGAGLNAALQLLVGWITEKPPIANSAVLTYETAVSSMVPAPLAVANRADESTCQQINPLVLGALTPRIVELDLEYFGGMWPQNSRSGVVYGAALAALTAALTVPPPIAPMGASPAAPANAAASVAQAAGNSAAGEAMRASSQSAQATMQGASGGTDAMGQVSSLAGQAQSLAQPLTGLMQMPMQFAQQGFGAAQGAMGSLTGMFGSGLKPQDAVSESAMRQAVSGGPSGGVGAATGSGGGAAGGALGAHPGAGLTSFTRPTSSFDPDGAGRPTGLRAGLLDAAEVRGPTTGSGMGGSATPMSPAGMLGRGQGEGEKDREATYARVVVDGAVQDSRRA